MEFAYSFLQCQVGKKDSVKGVPYAHFENKTWYGKPKWGS
jgi:hypothetical protein